MALGPGVIYAAFWAMLWSPSSRGGRLLGMILPGLVALTTILSALLVPIVAIRLFVRCDRDSVVLASGYLVGVAVQVIPYVLGLNRRGTVSRRHFDGAWAMGEYAGWALPRELLGETWSGSAPLSAGLGAWAIVACLVMVALFGLTQPDWRLAALAGGFSMVIFCSAIMLHGKVVPRYALVSGLMLFVAAAALLIPEPTRGRVGRLPIVALLVPVIVVGATNLRYPPDPRNTSFSWSVQLRNATAVCLRQQPRVDTVTFPTHPRGHPGEAWYVTLPCAQLTR